MICSVLSCSRVSCWCFLRPVVRLVCPVYEHCGGLNSVVVYRGCWCIGVVMIMVLWLAALAVPQLYLIHCTVGSGAILDGTVTFSCMNFSMYIQSTAKYRYQSQYF